MRRVTFFFKNAEPITVECGDRGHGYNPKLGSVGIYSRRFGMIVHNGVVNGNGAGTLHFERIEIDLSAGDYDPTIVPRKCWRVEGKTIIVGDGGECIPPRASFRVRWAPNGDWSRVFPESTQRSSHFVLGPVVIPLPRGLVGRESWRATALEQALQTGAANAWTAGLHTTNLGLWHPFGEVYCAAGGAKDIEPVSGWNQDSRFALLTHDLMMERSAIYCVDVRGVPSIPEQPVYTLDRGWSKTTQLEAFCIPYDSTNPYDDRRQPKTYNSGSCVYADMLIGRDRYTQYLAPDWQHLRRLKHRVEVAAEHWNDEIAKIDAEMLAADCEASIRKLGASMNDGSGYYGRRGWAWTLDACNTRRIRPRNSVQMAGVAQMPNGQLMRVQSDSGESAIPSPYTVSSAVPTPLSWDVDYCQVMESVFTAHVFVRYGMTDQARNMMSPFLLDEPRLGSVVKRAGYMPKFVGVGSLHGKAHRRLMSFAGHGDYFSTCGAGLMYWTELERGKDPYPYIRPMIDVALPTKGVAPGTGDSPARWKRYYDLLIEDQPGREQLVAMASALEHKFGF